MSRSLLPINSLLHSEPFFSATDSYQIPKNERFSFILRLMTSTKSLTFLYHWSQLLAGKTIVKKMNNMRFQKQSCYVLKQKLIVFSLKLLIVSFQFPLHIFFLWEQPKTTCAKRYIKYRLANALWYGNKKKSLTLSSYALHKNVLKRRTEKVLHRATTTTVLPLNRTSSEARVLKRPIDKRFR